MRLHLLCICLLLAPLQVIAQARWEAGLGLAGAGYQGELVPEWHPEFGELSSAYSLFVRYHLGPAWGLRLQATYSEISGDDRNFNAPAYSERNFRFQSQLAMGMLALEWEPWGRRRYPDGLQFDHIISPYLFTGLGLLKLDPAADFSQTRSDKLEPAIRRDKAVDFPQNRWALPLGAGIKLDLSPRTLLGLEFATTTAFTDYLDGISQAGRSDTNDWFSYAGVTLSFRMIAKDSDRDGIADKEDGCPQVPGVRTARGCPDQDGDGVEDLEDICPADAGPRYLNGCPDTDLDGVADHEDRCPLKAGTLATSGCPDRDGDEIADQDDACPKLPGPRGQLGCPVLDTDADGDLEDENPICMRRPNDSLLEKIEGSTRAAFILLDIYRPFIRAEPQTAEPEKKIKPEDLGIFNF